MLDNIYARIDFLKKGLEGVSKRNEIIANNIANIDTANYKAKDINFEQVLSRHLIDSNNNQTDTQNIKQRFNQFSIYERSGLQENINGNNVDIDNEMIALSENKMKYDLIAEALKTQLKLLNIVINASKE